MSARLSIAVISVALLASASLAAPALGYHARGVRWPGGVVRYYNAAPDQSWALAQAVSAWNRSGANVRFVAVSRADAQLVIRHDPSVASCRRADASVGFVSSAIVRIYPLNDASRNCNRYVAARSLTHELGHVLGLRHEDRGCSIMNAAGNYRGGAECETTAPWSWRCRLLEPDDVAGAVAFYGGTARPVKEPASCGLYRPIAAPRSVVAAYDPDMAAVALSFRRAGDPALPPFLDAIVRDRPRAFGYAVRRNGCPSNAAALSGPRYGWRKGQWTFAQPIAQLRPGRYCYALWSIDAVGRESSVTTAWVRVPSVAS